MRFKLVIEQDFDTPEMMASFATNYAAFLRGLGIDPERAKDAPAKVTVADVSGVTPIMRGESKEQPESSGDETAAAALPAANPRADDEGASLTPDNGAVPPAAPRRRRGRPSKSETEPSAPVAQTPVVEQPKPAQNEAASLFDAPKQDTKPEQKAEEPAAATGAVTLDMVKGLYAKALEPADGEEQIMKIHKDHGFVRLRECPAEKYAAVYASLQELIKRQALV